jgi:hypothetical protein
MFEEQFEKRLQSWHDFRATLETHPDPLQHTIDAYQRVPGVSIHTDPWDQKMWPQPWELISENQYCAFCTVLGMCYSLQLTERFKQELVEIHICIDRKKNETFYLLMIQNRVIGYDGESHISVSDLPKEIISQRVYTMPRLQ